MSSRTGDERRLPRLRPAGDEDVQPGDHAGVEESRRLRCQRSEGHQVIEVGGAHDELADVVVGVLR